MQPIKILILTMFLVSCGENTFIGGEKKSTLKSQSDDQDNDPPKKNRKRTKIKSEDKTDKAPTEPKYEEVVSDGMEKPKKQEEESCEEVKLAGDWQGTWRSDASSDEDLEGEWTMAAIHSDQNLEGQIEVSGAPCGEKEGVMTAKIEGCKVVIQSDLGNGNTGRCSFQWQARVVKGDPVKLVGKWQYNPLITGVFETELIKRSP